MESAIMSRSAAWALTNSACTIETAERNEERLPPYAAVLVGLDDIGDHLELLFQLRRVLRGGPTGESVGFQVGYCSCSKESCAPFW